MCKNIEEFFVGLFQKMKIKIFTSLKKVFKKSDLSPTNSTEWKFRI